MILWKQRLYAFLLRRVLGPFLDASANQKLHDSIDVSLQEGRIVLKNIGLNASHISERLASTGAGVSIRTASVEQLEVLLSLRENTAVDSNGNPAAQSSLVWRTMKLGTMTESIPAVSLVAEIRISGLKVELEIGNSGLPPVIKKVVESPVSQEPTSKSIIASYVDAALASLQLNLKLSNVAVRLVAPHSDTVAHETFVAVSLSTLSLNDLEAQSAAPGAKIKVALNKSMEMSNISIQVGTTECGTDSGQQPTTQTNTVCMAQGNSKVFYRVFESEHDTLDKSKQSLQQDIDVNLNQQLNVSFTKQSLMQLQHVARSFAEASSKANTANDQNNSPSTEKDHHPVSDGNSNDEDSDREDLKALTGIMKQYREAYHLAANNQLRGGILVPSNAYQDETDEPEEQDVTFDVFFDANDQSFYHAASVLKASTMMQGVTEEGSIQSKIRLSLLSGCFKIAFSNTAHSTRPHEYILASVAELNVSAFSAGQVAEVELSVSHFEIEDSQTDHAHIESPRQQLSMDVATTVSFAMESSITEEDDQELVVSQAPCISLHARRSKSEDDGDTVECDVNLYPMQVCLRQKTLSNLSQFFSGLSQKDHPVEGKSELSSSASSSQQSFALSCNCPSITVSLPVVRPVTMDPLFSRCGESLTGLPATHASLNLLLDTVAVNFHQGSCDDETLDSYAYFSCLNAIVFGSAPVGGKVSINSSTQRVDIALFAGRTEVNPHIPLSFEYRKKKESLRADGTLGRSIFPIVPVISSFKARQEDEDDDDRRNDRKDTIPVTRKTDGGDRKDPQIAMIAEAERSVATGSLRIPDVVVDLTRPELEVVLAMIAALSPTDSSSRGTTSPSTVSPNQEESSSPMSFGVQVDKFTLSIKEDYLPSKPRIDLFSCLFATESLRFYVQVDGSGLRNFRILLHNLCLYAALQPPHDHQNRLSTRMLEERIAFLKRRQRTPQGSTIVPILYRSQMFQPICDEAPSLIIDLRDQSNTPNAGPWVALRSIHLSLYHLSFRYTVEAAWMNRLQSLIPGGSTAHEKPQSSLQTPSSMTKVFATIADCNVDYSTPAYFSMQSRSILRVGDLRFSSNFLDPPSRSQAYLVSLGDVSMNISNQKLPYEDEDGKLCRASLLLPFHVSPRSSKSSPKLGATSEALLRERGFIEVLVLDSMDATVSVTDWNLPGRKRVPRQDPSTTTEVSVGLITLGACKDSFNCFAETIGELQAKLTALTDENLKAMAAKLPPSHTRETNPPSKKHSSKVQRPPKQNVLTDNFLLDGYEWTGIDHTPDQELEIPDGDEQAATWYKTSDSTGDVTTVSSFPSQIIHHHFPLQTVSHPLSGGDMGASKQIGENVVLSVKSRLLLHKLAVKVRLYDGFDWPEAMTENQKKVIKRSGIFLIEPLPREELANVRKQIESENARLKEITDKKASVDRKIGILSELLADQTTPFDDSPFSSTPLPHDRALSIKQDSELRRLKRRSQVCFQVSANGISARVDSFEEALEHRLASILSVSVSNLYFAETTSQTTPVKMFGEWLNENQHPRDSRHGALMLKMTTSKPPQPTTEEGELANDICEATVQLLPMRAIIDQRAIIFLQAFFNNDVSGNSPKDDWTRDLHLVPPPQFKTFKVKPWKLKVDYMPQRMDVGALREGSVVELVNISPIDGMIITLSQVDVREKVGFGDVIGSLAGSWLQEVVSTQLHKFVANARPFEPISDVGQGISDLVVLPYEAFKNGDDIQRAMSKGFKSLAETVTFQALTTTSKLTEYAANRMASVVGDRYHGASTNPLPSRPSAPPRGMNDVTGHAMASLARGFQTANYKVVIVPYREYSRNGTTGAVSSVLRGVPVMLVAPVSGAAEALSYTLLGARNALRPDIRKEEEASRTGFTSYDG